MLKSNDSRSPMSCFLYIWIVWSIYSNNQVFLLLWLLTNEVIMGFAGFIGPVSTKSRFHSATQFALVCWLGSPGWKSFTRVTWRSEEYIHLSSSIMSDIPIQNSPAIKHVKYTCMCLTPQYIAICSNLSHTSIGAKHFVSPANSKGLTESESIVIFKLYICLFFDHITNCQNVNEFS